MKIIRSALKTTSFIFVLIATLLLALHITHVIQVEKTEKGLWDFLPAAGINFVFILYPIFIFLSFFFYLLSMQVSDKFHLPVSILLFVNGLSILVFIVAYYV